MSALTKTALTAALAFAAIKWSLPVLALAAAAMIGVAVTRSLRRRSRPLNRFLSRAAGELPEELGAGSGIAAWIWFVGGLALLCAALAVLEIRQPYYFCQDDMLVGELPGLLFGLRSVWHGVFPEWNPYQFMGTPYASAGGGRLFYPPTYLAYAIARHVLGNEAAMVDVSGILHVVAGYFAVYWVLRRLGIGAALAAAGGLSVALSGSTLVMGRCWAMFIYGIVWTPLLMYSVARMARGPVGWVWVLLTGLMIGVLFQIGFVQLWVTVLLLMAATALLLWATGRIPLPRLPWLAGAVLLGTALAAPLMYQQWLLSRDMVPGPRDSTGIFVGLFAMLLPYPLAHARHPLDWGGIDSQYMGEMYYFGTLFALLLLLGLAAVLSGRRHRRGSQRAWGANIWAALALGVFVLALGDDGGAWQVMSSLPILNIVNHYPFRLLPFFTLFAVLGGATVGERLLRGRKAPGSRTRWELALALPTAGLLLWHVWFARSSFYQYGFRPTAALPADLAAILNAGAVHPQARLMGWAPQRSCLPEFRLSMKLNLPMADGLLAFDGYDPLLSAKPTWQRAALLMQHDPVAASKAYGVRWHVLSRLVRHPTFSVDSQAEHYLESSVLLDGGLKKLIDTPGALQVALKRPELNLADAGPVDPLAFPVGHPEHALPVTIGPSGVDVDTSTLPAGESVVVNWLWYPPMRADAGGRPIDCSADERGRIILTAPSSASAVHVRYRPSWALGVEIGAALALVSILMTGILQWLGRSVKTHRQAPSSGNPFPLDGPRDRAATNQRTTPAPVSATLSN
jgi:hypothetical protein